VADSRTAKISAPADNQTYDLDQTVPTSEGALSRCGLLKDRANAS
jgi:hypothetical protein